MLGDNWPTSGLGLFAGGYVAPGAVNVIDYVNFVSTGNAIDFGDLYTAVYIQSAAGVPTRGIVAGGGVALLRAKNALAALKADNPDEATGIQIISRAIESPLRTIVENAGLEGSVVVAKVAEGKGDFGYNAKTDEYVDMLKAGIIDPKKVTRVALENAASVAGMILTTECALVEIKEESAPHQHRGGGMPGMM